MNVSECEILQTAKSWTKSAISIRKFRPTLMSVIVCSCCRSSFISKIKNLKWLITVYPGRGLKSSFLTLKNLVITRPRYLNSWHKFLGKQHSLTARIGFRNQESMGCNAPHPFQHDSNDNLRNERTHASRWNSLTSPGNECSNYVLYPLRSFINLYDVW